MDHVFFLFSKGSIQWLLLTHQLYCYCYNRIYNKIADSDLSRNWRALTWMSNNRCSITKKLVIGYLQPDNFANRTSITSALMASFQMFPYCLKNLRKTLLEFSLKKSSFSPFLKEEFFNLKICY